MAKTKNINFEEAMEKLEDTIRKLELGSYSLEESIEKFEEAVHLIKLCEEKLSTAKSKVRMLVEGEDGTITDVPFVGEGKDEA